MAGAAACLRGCIADAYWVAENFAKTSPQTIEALALHSVFEKVLAAHGNFVLTLGAILHSPQPCSGLPVLGGLLSACWCGIGSIPGHWHTALIKPTTELQHWLEEGWHLKNYSALSELVTGLEHRWQGVYCSAAADQRAAREPAVQEISRIFRDPV